MNHSFLVARNVRLLAAILSIIMACAFFPTIRAQQQQQQQQQQSSSPQSKRGLQPPTAEIQASAKTECLATNDEYSSFHCLPLGEAQRNGMMMIPCEDAEVNQCPQWKDSGECTKNPQYMLVHCRQSCQSCIGLHQGGVVQIAPVEEKRSQVLQRLVETQVYQHGLADHSVASLQTCINKHEMCTHWSIVGECETNPHYMHRECTAACRTC